jgi:hypothetical protein
MTFGEKLAAAQESSRSRLALLLAPRLLQMPLPIQKYDDPFLPFGKAIIAATRDVVCAYVFDLAAYMALGAAGMVALERTIAYVGAETAKILHAPFASADYTTAASDAAFAVDAVTVTDEQYLEAYTSNPAMGAFVVRRGEHPVIIPLPGSAGVYWQDVSLFTMLSEDGYNLQMRLAGEKTLYAGRGDDFAERVRAALEAMR